MTLGFTAPDDDDPQLVGMVGHADAEPDAEPAQPIAQTVVVRVERDRAALLALAAVALAALIRAR
jgi:hypothetical protein